MNSLFHYDSVFIGCGKILVFIFKLHYPIESMHLFSKYSRAYSLNIWDVSWRRGQGGGLY